LTPSRARTTTELTEIFPLVKRVAIALELAQYNVLENNGARGSQTVFHAHVHLVPKPTAATALVVQPGLTAVDPTGLAERTRSRLAASRS
jgi:diadenosine tetraphosphate (Ap4A) HIT family hydrolase